ncbi:hypothetical protein [Methermicoccus shengliensis]|uniref:Uncharacterized protein n=1 Tax=Methermicoccus shengliensis TaxID=660064 RepID=A0A832RVS1_9EURY|nr:hypothetical protein [Methermicoccus shengliensis]KUK29689.1 MAG: hypothetical protein XD62_1233 [Methanosarcinales archeaon 56_1174]MDI3488147.1 hypothetical protein [Methanosarcinales archaeon]HIH69236.1 hypothetical protein [Methermicoccus shengliensis]
MNSKFLTLILAIFFVSVVVCFVEEKELGHPQENTVEIESPENQLKHLKNIQMEADMVIVGDEKVRELVNGKEHLKMLEIIYNDSYVEDFYRVGFQYTEVEGCEGYKILGGKIYKFSVDLSNKTVLSVEEVENQTLKIRDERFGEGATVHSLVSMNTPSGTWHSLSNLWMYDFSIEGKGDIRAESGSSIKQECLKHSIVVREVYNKDNFGFMIFLGPESRKVWCNAEQPRFECRNGRESIECEIVYQEKRVWDRVKPSNLPSRVGFSYPWLVYVKPNQTIAFDLTVKLYGVENGNTHEVTHDWRVILTSPPSPSQMSSAEMKEYGIEKTYNCNYYAHNPIIIVKKGGEVI